MKKLIIGLVLSLMLLTMFSACSTTNELVFADAGWDSIKFHNAVAGFIATNAFGYDNWREVSGTTPITHQGTLTGEINVHMEEWTDNISTYQQDLEDGKLKEVGINFDDNYQGFYVPRYVIEGDAERGIEPMAPDLKTVQDLKKYKDVFPDDEQPDKGRIYGAIPGWEIDNIMHNKYLYNGLDENFNYFRPGSDPALSAALSGAYEKGEPVVGYYWEPTWLLGKYDFVLLEDHPYDPTKPEEYAEGKTECPPVRVTIAVSNEFFEKDPEYCVFLSKYRSSSQLTSEALAHIQETGDNHMDTAKWYLKKYDEFLDDWLDPDKAQLIRDALK
ncbi:MAG TPA: ABC transporter substrate-binding protein [Thermoclostridium sp.]|nr:ABC transporter substrate-binding protein [Thermoclostridium sp.]